MAEVIYTLISTQIYVKDHFLMLLWSGYVLLSNNKLTGEVPFSICNNSDMTILDLSNNRLNGKIPHCLGKLSYYLTVSDLWMNNLQGVIPAKFANCESLRILSLSGNQWRDRYHILCLTVKIWKFLMLVTAQLVVSFPIGWELFQSFEFLS